MTDWMPIESAPKDGTRILAYRRDACVFTAHYVSPADILGDPDGDTEESWWSTDGTELSGAMMPTHWMPLPAPPAAP